MVLPAERLAETFAVMRAKRLEPKRMRLVHPAAHRPASLALIETVKDGGTGLAVLPPLVAHGPTGGYTKELKEIYSG
jgi:tRNA1(Val) A37 N6-methylase TrmN6